MREGRAFGIGTLVTGLRHGRWSFTVFSNEKIKSLTATSAWYGGD